MTAEKYMRKAISLAARGVGFVNPNPLVGAVIVKAGRIIGQGWHESYGGPHAERNALTDCTESPEGAAMYVTLEPCCHFGKTPPCTEAVIAAGISEVYVGAPDPNPLVAGKGVQALTDAGIRVVSGVLKAECKRQNEVFFHYIRTNTPFVVMKYAMTSDGKIATVSGRSRWITGERARERVHHDRHRYMAIMAGVGTVLADDPLLTCRAPGGKNPIRVICDTRLRTPLGSRIVSTARDVRTIFATACGDGRSHKLLIDAGCEIIRVPERDGHVDLKALMQTLGGMGVDSILLEGGAELNFSALKSGIVNKVQTYIAPKLFGGASAKTPVGGAGFAEIADTVRLTNQTISCIDGDILIESEAEYPCSQE